MLALRAVVGLTSLWAAAGCSFAPSGGASPGDGDGSGGSDSDSGPTVSIDSAPGDIGGDTEDGAVAALEPCAPADGLVACYLFESNLADDSGEKNDLSGSGYGFGAGSSGSALALVEGSEMTAIDDASLDFDQALTAEAWVAPGVAQQSWFIDHDNRWGIEIADDGALTCTVRLDGDEEEETEAIEVSGGDASGGWTHVACSYDGGQVRLYVEGGEVAAGEGEGRIHTGDGDGFTVGRDAPDGDSFVGRIDTVRVWSIARTAPEIACSAAGEC